MDDDELRYAAAEQILVASAICSLGAGIGASLHGLLVWPFLLALGAGTLAAAAALHPERSWSLRWGRLTSGASAAVWCCVLVASGLEPVLLAIALFGAWASGWASAFLHRAQRARGRDPEVELAASPPPLEDRYLVGIIEELPTLSRR